MRRVPGRGVVAAAARLVPFRDREAWRREWEAELTWAARRLEEGGGASPAGRFRLRVRAVACVIDALILWREAAMTGMWNEIRFALRGLFRSPGFTAVAVLTLALGIGANTAVFTLVDGVLLKPLPFPQADRLVDVGHIGRGGQDKLPMSPGLYVVYRDHARSFQSLAMYRSTAVNLVGEGEPVRVQAMSATPALFDVLRVQPALGRGFTADDGKEGAEPVAVLSHALWRDRFGGAPDVVGRTVVLDGTSRTIVGVLPEGFAFSDADAQVYIPMVVDDVTASTASFSPSGVARLAPGVTAEGANAELQGLIDRLGELRPDDPAVGFLKNVSLAARVRPLKEAVIGDVGRTLWILMGTVGFVLLIACANVANLLLVRAEGRQRELAVRLAIGAGRAAVLRPFLAESLALALAGGVLGVGVAWAAVRVATAMAPGILPRMGQVGIDPRVLAFTAAASLVAALLFGLFPVLRVGRTDLSGQLKDGGGRGGTGGRERHRVRNALVVTQMALALVLLVGSGLMLRSFLALRSVDPGFDTGGVLTVRLTLPPAEVPDEGAAATFFRQLEENLAAQPGVVAAGAAAAVPLGGRLSYFGEDIEDHPVGPDEIPPLAYGDWVDPGYFATLGIPVVEGRALQAGDEADGFRGVVVSQAFAKRWWPDGSAVGRRLRPGDGDWWQIVGVVGDAHYRGLEQDPEEMVYYPTLFGTPPNGGTIRTREVVVKTAGDPSAFLPVLRREVWALNPRIPLADPRTLDEVRRRATARTSFTVAMLGAASFVALLLGMVGIYGVIAYVVGQRTREIGLRMALGASGSQVQGMIVRQGLALAAVGVGLGLVAAVGMSSVMSTLLYGVSATDPLTYGAVALALTAVAALASWVPARRAAGVEPTVALREE